MINRRRKMVVEKKRKENRNVSNWRAGEEDKEMKKEDKIWNERRKKEKQYRKLIEKNNGEKAQ